MIFPFEGIEVDGLGFRAQCQLLLPPTDRCLEKSKSGALVMLSPGVLSMC